MAFHGRATDATVPAPTAAARPRPRCGERYGAEVHDHRPNPNRGRRRDHHCLAPATHSPCRIPKRSALGALLDVGEDAARTRGRDLCRLGARQYRLSALARIFSDRPRRRRSRPPLGRRRYRCEARGRQHHRSSRRHARHNRGVGGRQPLPHPAKPARSDEPRRHAASRGHMAAASRRRSGASLAPLLVPRPGGLGVQLLR
jgi:hypothetical protein